MIRDLKSSKKENTEITCEQKILHKKFIMTKTCVFEDCHSNSKRNPELKWASFVKPQKDLARAQLWIKNLSRLDFEVETISRDTYICELHFPPNECLKYWENLELTPFPRGQALTQYLRWTRRQNRQEEEKPSEPISLTQKVKETYKNDGGNKSTVKHVAVLSGVAMPIDYSIDLSTSDVAEATSLELTLPGKIFVFFSLRNCYHGNIFLLKKKYI